MNDNRFFGFLSKLLFNTDPNSNLVRRQRLKALAKEKLQSRLWPSCFACLLPVLISWGLLLFPSDLFVINLLVFDEMRFGFSLFSRAVSVVAFIFATGPLNAGVSGYFTRLMLGKKESALTVCNCFGPGYVRIMLSMLLYKAVVLCFAAIPLVLLLLPGMITPVTIGEIEMLRVGTGVWPVALLAMGAYFYVDTSLSMVPYLLQNDPKPSARETLVISYQMTRGHVVELIMMQLSFLLWLMVVALSIFIGMIYVYPYIEATYAAYYLRLSGFDRGGGEEPTVT